MLEKKRPTLPFLPYDVRYALRYREARLSTEEILILAHSNFEHEALYLLLKAAASDPQTQLKLLAELGLALADSTDDGFGTDSALRLESFVAEHINDLKTPVSVAAAKIAQLSRQGFEHWYDLMRAFAHQSASDKRQTYIVGHAMFVGLPSFLIAHRHAQKPLRILIPDLALDHESLICGYELGDDANVLPQDFPRDHEALIIDDTCRTGACRDKVDRFWRQGQARVPNYQFVVMDNVQ